MSPFLRCFALALVSLIALAGVLSPTNAQAQGRRNFGGGGILDGLRGGSINNERPLGGRLQQGGNAPSNRGRNSGGNQNNRPPRDGGEYEQPTNPGTPDFQAVPPTPSKPKPTGSAAVSVREFTPNTWLPAPAYPPRPVINRLRPELDDLATEQFEKMEQLLENVGVHRRTADLLRQTARRTGGDDAAVRDFEKAFIERDPDAASSWGELLQLDAEQLALAVLYVSNAMLRNRLDTAVADNDARSLRDFRTASKEFRDRLVKSQLDKSYQTAALECLDELTTTLAARAALSAAWENSKPDHQEAPAWESDEINVLADPRLEPGNVYYLAPGFVLAGAEGADKLTIVRSTLAGAFGQLVFDSSSPEHASEPLALLAEPAGVTFVNPAENQKAFPFQLNGYDFTLEPGTMREFANTDAQKIETFRYVPRADSSQSAGFNLVEQDGSPIRKAYFRVTRGDGGWSCERKAKLAMVRGSAAPSTAKVPVLYVRNATTAFVPYKFGQWDMKLAPGQGQGFDAANLPDASVVVQFTSASRAKPSRYTLTKGGAYQFVDRDGVIDLVPSPPYQVTIDNQSSPYDFAYTLAGEPQVAAKGDVRTHTFKLPPSELQIAFDAGGGREKHFRAALEKTYYVGVDPAMRLDLFADRSLALPRLTELLERRAERFRQIADMPAVEQLADKVPDARTDDPPPRVPADVPPVQPVERKPQAYVLAVGISKYADSAYDLKYADADAREFCDVFQKRAGEFYDRVHTTLLCNADATSLAVKKALNAIASDAQSGDVVVMFFSSHGLAANKRFYLGTHDLDPKDLLTTAVKHSDLVEPLERLTGDKQCQVILFIDTCNSNALAAVLPSEGEKGGAPIRPLSQDDGARDMSNVFSSAGKGCLVFASSASGQASLENPQWKHGAFTKALLDAIASPESDTDGDGVIGVIELDPAMNKILGDLTGGKQRVYVSWPASVKNFPLMKLAR